MAKAKSSVVTAGSGNVFADLGLADADELWTRVRLAASINAILAARKLTQAKAAELLGVNQPKISALKHYKLEGFSAERLMHFATALEHDVVIEIRPRAKVAKKGRILIVGATRMINHAETRCALK
jgi:predicted XRE-type DNA-binding protein